MKHRCPVCKNILAKSTGERARGEKFFPFCSERCKLVDLGAWFNADYRIASGPNSGESAETSDDDSPSYNT